MKKFEFDALILKTPEINSAYIEFPYDVKKSFGKTGRIPVKALFDNYEYRGSLVIMGHHCHLIGLNTEVRKAISKKPGDTVHVILHEDLEERVVEIPADLAELFLHEPRAAEKFKKMSFSHQKEHITWLNDAKKDETRQNRLVKLILNISKK